MVDLSRLPENLIDLNDGLSRVGGDEEFFIELLNDLAELGQDCLLKLKEAVNIGNRIKAREIKYCHKCEKEYDIHIISCNKCGVNLDEQDIEE